MTTPDQDRLEAADSELSINECEIDKRMEAIRAAQSNISKQLIEIMLLRAARNKLLAARDREVERKARLDELKRFYKQPLKTGTWQGDIEERKKELEAD